MKRAGGQVCPDLLCLRAAGVFYISAWFDLPKGDFMGFFAITDNCKKPTLFISACQKKKAWTEMSGCIGSHPECEALKQKAAYLMCDCFHACFYKSDAQTCLVINRNMCLRVHAENKRVRRKLMRFDGGS